MRLRGLAWWMATAMLMPAPATPFAVTHAFFHKAMPLHAACVSRNRALRGCLWQATATRSKETDLTDTPSSEAALPEIKEIAGVKFQVDARPAPGQPFHLAFPVHDLDAARHFWGTVLGCKEGRCAPGMQYVCKFTQSICTCVYACMHAFMHACMHEYEHEVFDPQ